MIRQSSQPGHAPVKGLFAEFGVRMAGFVVDLFIVALFTSFLLEQVRVVIDLNPADQNPAYIVVFFLYLAGFWASPLRSTPGQFLLGMRVVDEQGARLRLGPAALRSVVVMALVAAAGTVFIIPLSYLSIVALPAGVLLFLAALTPNQQACHDLLTHSVVVNRSALQSPERTRILVEHIADRDPGSGFRRRPSIVSMIGNTLIVGVPVFIMLTINHAMRDRELVYRTNYAVDQVRNLRHAVEEFHNVHQYFPPPTEFLGVASAADYPAGGNYKLEGDGLIRIRFEHKPELLNGTIVMVPSVIDGAITWRCRIDGDIKSEHLPRECRD